VKFTDQLSNRETFVMSLHALILFALMISMPMMVSSRSRYSDLFVFLTVIALIVITNVALCRPRK
jgi:energy-coupling factor transporter transmembrane protein EcfT